MVGRGRWGKKEREEGREGKREGNTEREREQKGAGEHEKDSEKEGSKAGGDQDRVEKELYPQRRETLRDRQEERERKRKGTVTEPVTASLLVHQGGAIPGGGKGVTCLGVKHSTWGCPLTAQDPHPALPGQPGGNWVAGPQRMCV